MSSRRSTLSHLISGDKILAGVDEDKLMKELDIYDKDGDIESSDRYYMFHKLRSKLGPKGKHVAGRGGAGPAEGVAGGPASASRTNSETRVS